MSWSFNFNGSTDQSDIFAYAMMANDPTSEVYLYIIDTAIPARSTASRVDELQIEYSQSSDYILGDPNKIVNPASREAFGVKVVTASRILHPLVATDIPAGVFDYRLYRAKLTDLKPGVVYCRGFSNLFPPGQGFVLFTVKPIKILPKTLPPSGITAMVVSDMHCGARVIDTPNKFIFCGKERPDIILMPGDSSNAGLATTSYNVGSASAAALKTNYSKHTETFTKYFEQFVGDFIPQIIADPGNHWVGNTASNGENDSSGLRGINSFIHFHPNELISPIQDPTRTGTTANFGCRHMAVTIGNYLQIISGDVYSNTWQSARELFLNHHNPDPGFCIWMCHSPMFSRSQRQNADHTLQSRLRNGMFRLLSERENTAFCFGGNIHVDSVTKKLSYAETATSNSLPIVDGHVSVSPPDEWKTIVEFGQGMIEGRADATNPVVPAEFFDRYERFGLNFHMLKIYPGKCIIETKTRSGTDTWTDSEVVSTHTFYSPLGIQKNGLLARSYSKDGRPVYPRFAV